MNRKGPVEESKNEENTVIDNMVVERKREIMDDLIASANNMDDEGKNMA